MPCKTDQMNKYVHIDGGHADVYGQFNSLKNDKNALQKDKIVDKVSAHFKNPV